MDYGDNAEELQVLTYIGYATRCNPADRVSEDELTPAVIKKSQGLVSLSFDEPGALLRLQQKGRIEVLELDGRKFYKLTVSGSRKYDSLVELMD